MVDLQPSRATVTRRQTDMAKFLKRNGPGDPWEPSKIEMSPGEELVIKNESNQDSAIHVNAPGIGTIQVSVRAGETSDPLLLAPGNFRVLVPESPTRHEASVRAS